MHAPWLLSAALRPPGPQHILVLGEPPPSELLPLLTSPHLAPSLVLLATHAPPLLPAHILSAQGPAVRILRLRTPLAVHDAGALRLLTLLERAQRAAARWAALEAPPAPPRSRTRARSDAPDAPAPPPRIAQYTEDPSTGEFVVPEPVLCAAPRRPHAPPLSASGSTASLPVSIAYPTPAHSREGSHTRLPLDEPALFSPSSSFAGSLASTAAAPPASPSRARTLAKRASAALSLSAANLLDGLFAQPSAVLSDADILPFVRPFDTLVNFLPAGAPDKALLKHAVLVSTLGARFLEAPPNDDKDRARLEKERARERRERDRVSRRASARFSVFSFASASACTSINEHDPADHQGHHDDGSSEAHPTHARTHIIHVLPATRHNVYAQHVAHEEKKLARSIEQFLLAFAGAGVARPPAATSESSPLNAPPSAYKRTTGTGPRRPPPSAYPAGRHRRLDGTGVGSSTNGVEEIELEHRHSTGPKFEDSGAADKRASTYSAFSAFSAFWNASSTVETGPKRSSMYVVDAAPAEPEQAHSVSVTLQPDSTSNTRAPIPYLVAPGVFGAPVRGGGAVKVASSVSMSRSMSSTSMSSSAAPLSSSPTQASSSSFLPPARPLSTGEALVLGALDEGASGSSSYPSGHPTASSSSTSNNANAGGGGRCRAWVGPGDVVVRHESYGSNSSSGASGRAGGSGKRREEEEVGRSGDESEREQGRDKKERYGERVQSARGAETEGEGEGEKSATEGESGTGESASESEWEGVLFMRAAAAEKEKEEKEKDNVKREEQKEDREDDKKVHFETGAAAAGLPTPPMSGAATPVEERAEPLGEVRVDGSGSGLQDRADEEEKRGGADGEDEEDEEERMRRLRRSLPPPPPPAKDSAPPSPVLETQTRNHRPVPMPPPTSFVTPSVSSDGTAAAEDPNSTAARVREALERVGCGQGAIVLPDNLIMDDGFGGIVGEEKVSAVPSSPLTLMTGLPSTTMTGLPSTPMMPLPSTPMTPSTPAVPMMPLPPTPMTTPGSPSSVMTVDAAHASDAHLPLSLSLGLGLGADRAMAASTPTLVPSSSAAGALGGASATAAAGTGTDAGSKTTTRGGEGKTKGRMRIRALHGAIRRFAVWRGKEEVQRV